jgi:hypothetical protein
MDVVLALSSIQTALREMMRYPDRYGTNGHWSQVQTLTRELDRSVHAWMARAENDRRHEERRIQEERRIGERRAEGLSATDAA